MSEATPLAAELLAFLRQMVGAQRSGKHEPVMGFALARGRAVWLKRMQGGEEERICEGVTAAQLRALDAAGLLSVSTPRSHWRLRLRPAAYERVDAEIS